MRRLNPRILAYNAAAAVVILVTIAGALTLLPVASRDVASVTLVLLLGSVAGVATVRGIQRGQASWLVAGTVTAGATVYALAQPGPHHLLGIGAGMLLLVISVLYARENRETQKATTE